MIKLPRFLFKCSMLILVPVAAQAAGTYYTGNYQSPQQQRYQNQSYTATRGGGTYTQNGAVYNRTTGNMNGYSNYSYSSTRGIPGAARGGVQNQISSAQQGRTSTGNAARNGFTLGGGVSRQVAKWQFEMKDSGSKLHYDDVAWNVLDLNGAYAFDLGSMALKVDAGLMYGMQGGDSDMVDDDVTSGGYFITQWIDSADKSVIGEQIGHALSVGTSSGGNMYGFNLGVGLPSIFSWGNVKFTPSVGYRYFKYKLETKKNYGLSVDTAACFQVEGSDEVQCDPAIIVHYEDGTQQILWRDDISKEMQIEGSGKYVGTGGTYYYQQPGTSHSYEVEWSGPYLAMDMDYEINKNNSVNGRVELGFPGYTSTGDQPYRFDWQHSKSVEDKAGMFSALHLGMGANWMTAITDMISLTVGVTYDYYTVSDVDAKTYLNPNYYNGRYDEALAKWEEANYTEADMLNTELTVDNAQLQSLREIALNVKEIEEECPGWVCSASGEIESFYKSLGVRLGIVAKF